MLLENSEGKFAEARTMNENKIRQTLWGYREGAKYYVFPKAFRENLCEGFDVTQASKILIANEMLIPGSGNKSSRTERIHAHNKQPDRFYVIDLTKVDQGDEESFCL
jgi:uncharacterized protein (DUF927 family)